MRAAGSAPIPLPRPAPMPAVPLVLVAVLPVLVAVPLPRAAVPRVLVAVPLPRAADQVPARRADPDAQADTGCPGGLRGFAETTPGKD